MLNRKNLFHRNLIEEQHETTDQDHVNVQNIEGNASQFPVVQGSDQVVSTQGRSGIVTDTILREDGPLSGSINNVNLITGNRSQSSHNNQRLQSNKKDNKTVKRVQGKWIK